MTTLIYALTEPTGEIRYIGKTIRTLRWRLDCHMSASRIKSRTHKARWIRKLLRSGQRPRIMLLEECGGDGAAEERFHIALARADGIGLTNSTVGGEGCQPVSEETRRKLSVQMSKPRKPHSVITRARQSAAKRGKRHTAEHVTKRLTAQHATRRFPGWDISVHPAVMKATRISFGWSKARLARLMNVTDVLVGKYESGSIYPSKQTGPKLQAALGLTIPAQGVSAASAA